MSNWWLDELVTAGPEHLDAAYVAGYDAKAQFDPQADIDLMVSLGLDERSTVIDLGAGTGTFALAAAELGASVTAVDVSSQMVTRLRHRAAERNLPNLTVVEAGFLSYRHRAEPVDLVFSRNALHQLPDFWKVVALRQIGRLLKSGGIFRLHDLTFDMELDQIEQTIEAWMSSAVEDPARGYTADEFAAHIRTEFSTFTWLLEAMLGRAGFELIGKEIRGSVYAAYTCRMSPPAPDSPPHS